MQVRLLAALAAVAALVSAGPITPRADLPPAVLESSDSDILRLRANKAPTTPFTSYQQYQVPAQLSQGAYCGPRVGATIADAQVLWTAGDGGDVPVVYVAHSKSKGIIVSHQGTNTSSFDSVLNDVDFFLDGADSRLAFLGSGVRLHGGFQDAWKATADDVLTQVRAALVRFPGSPVFTTGHSLGAALSLLDALYLKDRLGSGVRVTSATFGLPRTGNPTFANAVDAQLPGFVHINNGRDPVPRLPGGDLGFQQPSGEVWINLADGLAAVSCPGQENENCILGVSPLTFSIDDHTGVYFRVRIAGRGANCPPVVA